LNNFLEFKEIIITNYLKNNFKNPLYTLPYIKIFYKYENGFVADILFAAPLLYAHIMYVMQ